MNVYGELDPMIEHRTKFASKDNIKPRSTCPI